MKRFFRKALVWFAGIVATLSILLILLYAEEDWRGARNWAACQRDLAAKGETLDLRQLAPPGKPEDDLSKVPIFAELYRENEEYQKTKKGTSTARIHQIEVDLGFRDYSKSPKSSFFLKGEPIDLPAWQKYYRSIPKANLPEQVGTPAQDILKALSQFDPDLTEIDKAVSNPNAYWPINYEMPFAGYLGGVTQMLKIAKVLQLKAVAHLENHETDLAEKDYLFSCRLNRPLTNGCFIINYLVLVGDRAIDDSILWEGFRRHVWTDVQLHEMESALASTDMLDLAVKSYRTERTFGIKTMDFVQSKNPWTFRHMGLYETEDPDINFLIMTWFIRPNGWWSQDRIHYSYGMQRLINSVDSTHGILNPDAFKTQNDGASLSIWKAFYAPLSKTSMIVEESLGSKIAKAETYRRLARLACRLEEYHIAHEQYPEKLDDLPDLPPHLNQEVLSEQPLHYQRKGNGYLFYSIGWNQKDDGGVNFSTVKIDGTETYQEPDWVWPSP